MTDNHKEQRLDICRELLRRSKSSRRVHGHTANAGGDFLGYDVTFLDSIVTGDETWLHHCTPEKKQDSMTWKHPSSPVAKKFKVMRSAKKIMGTVLLGQSWCSSVRNLTTWRNNQCCKVLPNS